MYRSTDARGNPVAVTGTYFEPDNPWPGNGPRPLISLAVATHGQGDRCAPSRLFNQGIHFSSGLDIAFESEEGFIATMVARGFAIVVTDYEGLGTPGVHTYANRVAQGQAVLDAARAAMRLPATSLDPHGPVALWGFSQGGGAVASAAELAPSYAPELGVVGTYASAPPADLTELLPYADGSVAVGIVGYFLNGLIAAYPETAPAIHDKLTIYGEDLLDKTQHQCANETVLTYAFHHLQEYFTEDQRAHPRSPGRQTRPRPCGWVDRPRWQPRSLRASSPNATPVRHCARLLTASPATAYRPRKAVGPGTPARFVRCSRVGKLKRLQDRGSDDEQAMENSGHRCCR